MAVQFPYCIKYAAFGNSDCCGFRQSEQFWILSDRSILSRYIINQYHNIHMGILALIVFGAIVGILATWIAGGGYGLLWDIVLGIVGSLVGGWIMNLFGKSGVTGFNLYSIIVGVVGAIIVIAIVRAFHHRKV
jgi:uncharacterized membrane protein YeaQ/YmgE (transglycosylase-associated protein family)